MGAGPRGPRGRPAALSVVAGGRRGAGVAPTPLP